MDRLLECYVNLLNAALDRLSSYPGLVAHQALCDRVDLCHVSLAHQENGTSVCINTGWKTPNSAIPADPVSVSQGHILLCTCDEDGHTRTEESSQVGLALLTSYHRRHGNENCLGEY